MGGLTSTTNPANVHLVAALLMFLIATEDDVVPWDWEFY
jgi:hypothetical protein